jgi:hypothetical protein
MVKAGVAETTLDDITHAFEKKLSGGSCKANC